MANKLYNEAAVQNIANAIRQKKNTNERFKIGDMASAIDSIPTNSGGVEDLLKHIIERDIISIAIPEGVQNIGAYVFNHWDNLQNITLPSTLKITGVFSFAYCAMESIDIPDQVTDIREYSFYYCRQLKNITIPNTLKTIGTSAFGYCVLSNLVLPASITTIGNAAFGNNNSLTTVRFLGTPTKSISANAFANCNGLSSILVPWSEGDVPNAPWGAINATITYNYTGD